jgi:glyoxylase I family protein
MDVRRLDHVSVPIRDLARARAFYEDLLGLAQAPRPDLGVRGAWYAVGGAQVHLIERAAPLDGIDPTGPHVALEVPDLAAVKQTLEARGIPYLALGEAQLWVRDPDGNVIELCLPR